MNQKDFCDLLRFLALLIAMALLLSVDWAALAASVGIPLK